MPREYRLDPYGDVARAASRFGGNDMARFGLSGNGWSVTPVWSMKSPGFRFRSSFAEGGMVGDENPLMDMAQNYGVQATSASPMPTTLASIGANPNMGDEPMGIGGQKPSMPYYTTGVYNQRPDTQTSFGDNLRTLGMPMQAAAMPQNDFMASIGLLGQEAQALSNYAPTQMPTTLASVSPNPNMSGQPMGIGGQKPSTPYYTTGVYNQRPATPTSLADGLRTLGMPMQAAAQSGANVPTRPGFPSYPTGAPRPMMGALSGMFPQRPFMGQLGAIRQMMQDRRAAMPQRMQFGFRSPFGVR